jgi:hypothetical protein
MGKTMIAAAIIINFWLLASVASGRMIVLGIVKRFVSDHKWKTTETKPPLFDFLQKLFENSFSDARLPTSQSGEKKVKLSLHSSTML